MSHGYANDDTYAAVVAVDNDPYLHELAGIWTTSVETLREATIASGLMGSWVNPRQVDWQGILDRAQDRNY